MDEASLDGVIDQFRTRPATQFLHQTGTVGFHFPQAHGQLGGDLPVRLPGTAVLRHRSPRSVPLALRANLQHNHVVHQRVVIICAVSEDVPTVPAAERLRVDETEYMPDGLVRVSARYGFKEDQDIAGVLAAARFPELNWRRDHEDHADVSYFVSRITLRVTNAPGMSRWRKKLFVAMAHNASSSRPTAASPPAATVSETG